ncbi:hypothetical protein [Evansella clarkii]|uniref:hypothetical protein n=1 Tax=Evansella clarkii TaxID=79879 RepID=UPI0009980569|nr:hypothetical protein [Evansella clarkii]
MYANKFAELYSTSYGGEKRISAKYQFGKLSRVELHGRVLDLIENIKKDNSVVNIYLYEDGLQKKYHNCYCRIQWADKNAKYVPGISEDEIIHGDIYIKWMSMHDSFKRLIEKEEE